MPYYPDAPEDEIDSRPAAALGRTGIDPTTGYDPPKLSPTREQVWSSSFQQGNMVVNLAERLFRETYAPVDGYDPFEEIKGTHYLDVYGDRFTHSRSPAETAGIKARIDRERMNHEIMAQGGVGGVIAGMVADNLDPTLFLPGSVAFKTGKTGINVSRAALSIAPAMVAQSGMQELALQANQETRTAGESIASVATSTIVGAVLGAGLGRLVAGPEREYFIKQTNLLRRDLDIMAAGGTPTPVVNVPPKTGGLDTIGPASGAAGAQVTDTRVLQMVSTPGLTWTKIASPTRRVAQASSIAARRILWDMVDMPYRTTQALEGVAVSGGPAVDNIVKAQVEGTKYLMGQELTRLYSVMRHGAEVTAPRARAAWQDIGGPKGMTYTQFKKEVTHASMFKDEHEIPEVAQAAKFMREKVWDPIATEAERVIPGFKKIEPVDGESYFPHLWDRQKIIDNPRLFTEKMTEHYVGDQETKFGLQQSLNYKNAQLTSWNDQIKKLEAMGARAEASALSINTRAAERSRDDIGQVVSMHEPGVAPGRAAELQAREITHGEEAKLFSDLLDSLEKANVPIPALQRRVMGQFETREKRAETAGIQHKEAGLAASRSERRLKFLEEKLSAKEERQQLIEDHLIVARQQRDAVRGSIEEDIGKWQGGSSRDAKAAIKAREKSASQKALEQAGHRMQGPQLPEARVGERLTSADDAIDKAVRDILASDRTLSREELQYRADQTVQRILGSPDGRLPYEGDGNPFSRIGKFSGDIDDAALRGSQAHRALNVTNAWARDWILDDVEEAATTYMRSMVPDIHLADRFGDAELNAAKRTIDADYRELARNATSKEAARAIDAEHKQVIRDLAGMRDRIRGVYGWTANGENMARVVKGIKTVNNITLMGSSALASLADISGTVWQYGLMSTFRDGWLPFVRSLSDPEYAKLWKAHKAEMRAMGIGVETALGLRQHSLDDVTDSQRPHSQFERTLNWAGDKFFVANLLNPLTDIEKMVAAHVAMSNMLRGVKAIVEGKATRKQIADLADVSIDGHMAQKIWDEFNAKGHRPDAIAERGVFLANTGDWVDRQAALTFNGAIRHSVNMAVVTPGQEIPFLFSKPGWTLLGQFKTFTAASMERTLIANVQRRDAASLQGLLASTGLGGMVYTLQQLLAGKPVADDPGTFAREAMARAGWPAWGEEINSFTRKIAGFDIYSPITNKESTKYQSRRAVDTLMGPTFGQLQNMFDVVRGGAASAKGAITGSTQDGSGWTASTTTALRKLLPLQNAIGIRRAYDAVEEGYNNAFGIKPKRKPPE